MNQEEVASYHRIGLAANQSLRRGPGSPLTRLVRELDPYLRARRPHLYVLEATYRTLLECGLLHDYPYLHCLPSGRLGGLVDLGAAVVGKDVAGLANFRHPEVVEEIFPEMATELDCVVYLIDPYDPKSTLPDTLALKRECVLRQKPFLSTYTTAREWFTLLWDDNIDVSAPLSFLLDEDLYRLLDEPPRSGIRPLRQQGIALIAHDGKKLDMLEYAADEFSFLSEFRTRLSTGTTGALLNGNADNTRLARLHHALSSWKKLFAAGELTCPPDLEEKYRQLSRLLGKRPTNGGKPFIATALDDRQELVDDPESPYVRLRRKLTGRPNTDAQWVEKLNSGPEGGDLQVGEAILMGLCENILFFEDTTVPHEHEVDIQLFERAARIPNQPSTARLYSDGVMCLHDKKSATTWARMRTAAASRRPSPGMPITLVTAFRRIFGVELVLPASPNSGEAAGAEATWEMVAEAAAWYLTAEITSRGDSPHVPQGLDEPIRATIMRGRGMRDIVNAMEHVVGPAITTASRQYDASLEDRLRDIESRDTLSEYEKGVWRLIAKRKCLSKTYYRSRDGNDVDVVPPIWAVQDVLVAPFSGKVGIGAPLFEGSQLAREIAHVFRGSELELLVDAFVLHSQKGPETTSPPTLQAQWGATDIAVVSCDAPSYDGERRLPYPDPVCAEIEQTSVVAEVGGIFLTRKDGAVAEVVPQGYERQGMSSSQLRMVARGESGQVSILVAGIQSRRLEPVLAALEFGLASVLVTDLEFARKLLRRYLSKESMAAGQTVEATETKSG